ncbi:hypothetical protein [Nocardia cyriacigeorgica]|uniref:hypothetical protein n=1 Tax=Nocardia cyriacigeorgica TaxID=135487 RepID=UPI0024549910|nr:hypothetical protein [Nocardia cyriacigeorgica]
MSLSVDKVRDLLESYEDDGYSGGWSWWAYESNHNDGVEVPGLGKVWVVEHIGGGEGGGEHVHLVLKIRMEPEAGRTWRRTRYFQKNGYYASFNGTDWDGGFFEVQQVERRVTMYERVGQ